MQLLDCKAKSTDIKTTLGLYSYLSFKQALTTLENTQNTIHTSNHPFYYKYCFRLLSYITGF